ncbi:MAG TPA: septal ring lytic transglycosylase RlpA family protein [Caulobacteraceae bacterium]|nr:septal ring lytic transglycosylase RlpA family protein [Caulobacteraceae bacterium]
MSVRSIDHALRAAFLLISAMALTACVSMPRAVPAQHATRTPGTMRPYQVGGHWYYPAEQPNYSEVGYASWYGDSYGCRVTADGEAMDPHALTAAHKTLPLPSIVEVTNLENGKKTRVRVNDRGPFVAGRIIDLSHAAAEKLGVFGKGTAKVRVKYIGPADLHPSIIDAAWRSGGGGRCR